MASTDLVINIIGNAKSAVDALEEFGNKAKESESKWTALKTGVTIGSAAIVAGIGSFAKDSIEAFAGAEEQQAQLERAYEKFPAVANVSIDALRALNSEIQAKTGYDDDALAASEASLAQFGLTGEQIRQLTPLMADYAAKTGKDLPTAADDLGKAVLGQGKALKAVGVDFKDAGSSGANFDQLMKGLDGTVGGFADTMGETASGKAKILATEFENIQETVGQMLMPALKGLTDIGVKVTKWLSDNPTLVTGLATAVGVLAGAVLAINVAMWANTAATWASNAAWLASPITWIVVAIVALIAAIVALAMNWDQVTQWVATVWAGFITWITGVMDGFVGWWNGIWAAVGQWISDVWSGFVNWIVGVWNGFVGFLMAGLTAYLNFWIGIWNAIAGFVSGVWNGIVSAVSGAIGWVGSAIQNGLTFINDVWSNIWNGLGGIVRNVFNGVLDWIGSGINGAIDLINGMIGAVNNIGGGIGIHLGLIGHVSLPHLAAGTITNGPMVALVGDNPGGREVIAPYDSYIDELRYAAGIGQASNPAASRGGGPMSLDDRTITKLGQIIGRVVVDGINRGNTQLLHDMT